MKPRRGANPVPAAIIMTGARTFIGSRKLTTLIRNKPSDAFAAGHCHGIMLRNWAICHAFDLAFSGPCPLLSSGFNKLQKQSAGSFNGGGVRDDLLPAINHCQAVCKSKKCGSQDLSFVMRTAMRQTHIEPHDEPPSK